MTTITTFEQADTLAKSLLPTHGNTEATVVAEPVVYDGKMFWMVTYVRADTKEAVTIRGSITYIADNGKLIRFSSNPLVTPFGDHEKLLVAEYDT
ncbi:hypothetical protein KA093_02015 [Candidatus Saccharibacteria bacterium]|nr:hypothetical protein [Candidatus Saccharibacteria bacterium]